MRQAELTLEDMLSDIVVQLIMDRDGVTADEIRAVMASLRRHRDAMERAAPQALFADAA